jgi:hypothetical protein
MNTLVRFASVAAVLGTALVFSGCVSTPARSSHLTVEPEFSVVESSTEKELTPEQIADLRQAVANYLRGQGLTDGRTYFVRVTFPTTTPDEEPQWAVVRIGGQSVQTYTVIAAYPGRDDYYPYDFYSAGYTYSNYNPGYGGFSRWGYYDPFDYNYGYYHRPEPRNHGKSDKPDKPDQPHKPNTPVQPEHKRSPGPSNRWNNPSRRDDDQPRGNAPSRPPTPDRWNRDRSEPRGSQPRPERSYPSSDRSSPSPERSHPSTPERTYTPPPERAAPPPPDNNRPEPVRGGNSQSKEQER